MQITDEQIEALSDEAGAAGDLEAVRLCDLALDGDTDARAKCASMIEAAAAMAAQ